MRTTRCRARFQVFSSKENKELHHSLRLGTWEKQIQRERIMSSALVPEEHQAGKPGKGLEYSDLHAIFSS